jgi:streptothricin acetyltransferase
MTIEIRELGPDCLEQYAEVPISFRVESIFRLEEMDRGLGGLLLREEPVAEPYLRDYDAEDDLPLSRWRARFDVSNWGFFVAFDEARPVGGATAVWRTPNVWMLDRRDDLAVLWDLRVHPDYRGQGVGKQLFHRVVAWARARECRQLKIEAHNTNVRACRFYAGMGCHLGAINRYAYRDRQFPHEVAVFWYLDL